MRCNLAQAVIQPLTEARRGNNIFIDQAGFSRLKLSGNEFRFFFQREGYIGTAYVKRILEEVTRLASLFN
ncbi:MAG: hypothetical protein NTX59_12080 [Elusimicrobia bacterium]|nr:hypothetical protein [Elusimicrobiota bacterium]